VKFGAQIPVGTDPGHPRVHSCPALAIDFISCFSSSVDGESDKERTTWGSKGY